MTCKPRLMLCQRSDFYESEYYSVVLYTCLWNRKCHDR